MVAIANRGVYRARPVASPELPFSLDEYRERHARVQAEMARRDLDVLYVTSPANLVYLTGYEAIWYPWRLPVGVLVDRASDELVVFDWARHEHYVRTRVLHDALVLFRYDDVRETVVRALAERGVGARSVGLERWSPNPSAPVLEEVADGLRGIGAEVTSGDWVVDTVRLYKSPAELERIRRAAAIADDAFAQLRLDLRPGVSELELSTHLGALLARHGSELPACQPLVSSGPTAWCDTHAFPSRRRLQPGDVVAVDACAVVDRYHANLARTFGLGGASSRARELIALAAGSLGELQRNARIGDAPEHAAAAAERYVLERIPAEQVWWIGGYALGLGLPPSWVGHTYLANDGLERCTLEPGYVSNFENVLVDRDEGFAAVTIDTLVVTETGIEALSTIPRELLDVPL
jgi:Xaa-Pro aminopeptidase